MLNEILKKELTLHIVKELAGANGCINRLGQFGIYDVEDIEELEKCVAIFFDDLILGIVDGEEIEIENRYKDINGWKELYTELNIIFDKL